METTLKRNGFLSTLLVLIIVVNVIVGFLFILTALGFSKNATLPTWMIIYSIFQCLGNVACMIAVFNWKRWGVVGYGAIAVISYIVNAIVTGNYTNIIGLAGSSILVALILPYWKQMK